MELSLLLEGKFLATLAPVRLSADGDGTLSAPGSAAVEHEEHLPYEADLTGYTRDPAVAAPPPASPHWREIHLRSTDGRGKLAGFKRYLADRKKAAVGPFSGEGGEGSGLIVVPHAGQPADAEAVFVRFATDAKAAQAEAAEHRRRRKLAEQQKRQQHQQEMQRRQAAAAPPVPAVAPKRPGKAPGILGKLMGAQRRTAAHLQRVPLKAKTTGGAPGDADVGAEAQRIIGNFRDEMLGKMEAFRDDPGTFALKVPFSVAAASKGSRVDASLLMNRVTMDVLKYMVYESAEEVGEDKWVASKEAGEFLDEMVVAVYKEGHVPPEVLEDMNQGDLPEEVKAAQRAAAEAALRDQTKKVAADTQRAVQGKPVAEDLTSLNVNKRDRTTIEDHQLEKENKRQRG